MMRWITRFLSDTVENSNWLIREMDVTQWAIVAVVFVLTGFMALKTRI